MTGSSSGDYVSGDYTLTTGTSGTTGGSVWVSGTAGTVSNPYTTITTSATTGGWAGSAVYTPIEPEKVQCRFCDKAIEIGIVIQSKGKKQTHVCVNCAKEYMGGEKIKELFDMVESLATMAEVAKT